MATCNERNTRRLFQFALFLLFLALLAPPPVMADTRTVSAKKPFSIRVAANPSTGYQWEVKFDKTFLELRAKKHTRDSSKPKGMVGVGGTTTFTFVPLKAGETSIKFQYKRPWEKKAVRFKTIDLKILP